MPYSIKVSKLPYIRGVNYCWSDIPSLVDLTVPLWTSRISLPMVPRVCNIFWMFLSHGMKILCIKSGITPDVPNIGRKCSHHLKAGVEFSKNKLLANRTSEIMNLLVLLHIYWSATLYISCLPIGFIRSPAG